MDLSAQRDISDVLFAKDLLTTDQLASIKLEVANSGRDAQTIIKDRKLVSTRDIAMAQGELYKIPYHEISDAQIPSNVLDLVAESVAKKYTLFPFEATDSTLKLVMVDPLDLQIIDFLERQTNRTVTAFIGDVVDVTRAINEQYGKSISKDVTAVLEESGMATKISENLSDINKVEEVVRDAPVARIVSTILEYAVKARASDIHIEPEEERTRVRYRIDGVLQEKLSIPKKVHNSLVARIKILANLKIDEHRLPQDGRFKVQVGTSETDLRISTLPTAIGEKIVIRLLKEESTVLTLQDLGVRGNALRSLQEALLKSNGIILVTGPTGSGKTVTLAACLTKLNTVRVNIVTLEDPVEIRLPGVNQVQINSSIGLSFASVLRSILRQDPNVIMVGEIRDGETAGLAVNAALTGHLVLSTLHTNSASGAIPRLLDMGVENFLLASTINVVVAQRLVRNLCQYCKASEAALPDVATEIKNSLGPLYKGEANSQVMVYKAVGCDKCDHSGYHGRGGIFVRRSKKSLFPRVW
ncbi:MAG: GspE/PulE family protein [candidate division WWE3 bacterium]|nr:GspE/PulE family protein [candidate division WWE3 bacterium]